MNYNHISFDVWGTLLKSNPEFKAQRIDYFWKSLNPLKKTMQEIDDIFSEVKYMCDRTAVLTGTGFTPQQVYSLVLTELCMFPFGLTMNDLDSIVNKMNGLFYNYPPHLFDPEIADILKQLHKRGCTFSLLSNTFSIPGRILKKTLEVRLLDQGFYNEFYFCLFSDEAIICKPNPALFLNLINGATQMRRHLSAPKIIHVGDNQVCDIDAAKKAGVDALMVHTNGEKLSKLLEICQH